jgi:uncharacterized protein YacL
MVSPTEPHRRGKSWRFPKKYYTLLFGAIMGSIMSLLTSLAVTVINIGVVPHFFQIWLSIFLTTFAIGFPITIMVTPFVKNIADRISSENKSNEGNKT